MDNAATPPVPLPLVQVERWPTEIPLLIVVALAAAGVWIMAAFTLILLIYAVVLGVFFFMSHLLFVTYVRGSAVRIGPRQFPELYQRVVELSQRAGLKRIPEAYVMQAGGSLNALATKFLGSHMVVLFADLLAACEGDAAARDMIIGHEIGHIRSGHLRFHWFLLPGFLVPFVGAAYSRARERTCDRWGAALCGDPAGAVRGLTILAAGASHAPRVNFEAFARQREDLGTGWMTLGMWLSTYPPLSSRILAVEPALLPDENKVSLGPVKALGILGAATMVPILISAIAVAKFAPKFLETMREAGAIPPVAASAQKPMAPHEVPAALSAVAEDFDALEATLQRYHQRYRKFPRNTDFVYKAWLEANPSAAGAEPRDPFDGYRYGYTRTESGYELYSSGPDGDNGTEDDIYREFNGSD